MDELFGLVDLRDEEQNSLGWEHFYQLVVIIGLSHRNALELLKIEVNETCLVNLCVLFHYYRLF